MTQKLFFFVLLCILLDMVLQGHAVCQLCKTQEEVTVFGTASYHKHEAIKTMVTHLFDHVVDYSQEVRK